MLPRMSRHPNAVGAIGSLLAAHLSKYSNQAVKLIVRRGSLYNDFVRQNRELTIERDGQQLHVSDIDAELIAPMREATDAQSGHPFISEKQLQEQRVRDSQRQSLGYIDSLFVTTKAPAVLPAIQQLLPRLTSQSTIVLLQNGGGVVDSLINNLFPDEKVRPNFVVGVNTHGCYVKTARRPVGARTTSAMHTVWAGVGSINFAVMPNVEAHGFLSEVGRGQPNPLLVSSNSTDRPSLNHLPLSTATRTLHSTVSSMLACQPLNFEWLGLPELLRLQRQKVAVNCVINPLTAIFDVQNGVLLDQDIDTMAQSICFEASRVFAEQERAELSQKLERGLPVQEEHGSFLLENGRYPPSHELSTGSLHARAMQVARTTDENVSSMLADIRNGARMTEM